MAKPAARGPAYRTPTQRLDRIRRGGWVTRVTATGVRTFDRQVMLRRFIGERPGRPWGRAYIRNPAITDREWIEPPDPWHYRGRERDARMEPLTIEAADLSSMEEWALLQVMPAGERVKWIREHPSPGYRVTHYPARR